MKKSNIYHNVGSVRPGKSVFNLSYKKMFTCDMGQLIPVMCDEVVPGDFFKIGNEAVLRFMPLVAPILHEVNMYVHYFFVPYRLLWEYWEDFITGGISGVDAHTLPTWDPGAGGQPVGSLWDYLGFPTGVRPVGAYPLSFPRSAYNLIYNEYYTDETLIGEVDLTNDGILYRCWTKDYFTSSLPFQMRGIAPALPLYGTSSAEWASTYFQDDASGDNIRIKTGDQLAVSGTIQRQRLDNMFNANTVDLSSGTSVDISDLRLAFQIQKWMERNARAGYRYTEFLRAHFGVSPNDERLQRPEYIGGSKSPVIFSEVLQTSSTDTTSPQGNLAGHGIAVSNAYCGKYYAQEFGLIMGIMSVMPKPTYQQGIDRQWLRQTRYDYYFPEFANLSEQAITNAEIYATDSESQNVDLFGYQGRYDEMRTKNDVACGLMRTTFDYWHLGRIFAGLPVLNANFLQCVPSKRIFAVESDPGMIISFGNIIKAVRPIPVSAEPGFIDHN